MRFRLAATPILIKCGARARDANSAPVQCDCMSFEILDKAVKFIADPMGCDEVERTSTENGSGHGSLDLHYPTKAAGEVYDANSSFWDRRKQDYCRMPAAAGLIQTGGLGVGGLAQMSRGMGKAIPAWLERWLNSPKPTKPPKLSEPIKSTKPHQNSTPLRVEEFRSNGQLSYVIYDGGKFVSSVIFRSKGPISSAQCEQRLGQELIKINNARSSSKNGENVVIEGARIIHLD